MLQRFFAAGHEQIVVTHEAAAGYRGIIALHSTKLGPAVGGTRLWNYPDADAALEDVLRLSRGMTYKNAAAGLPWGGGKAVIIADARTIDREQLFLAHGRAIAQLRGRFITGEDVGTSPADMEIVARETRWVAGTAAKGGDPSPWTARGIVRGILACAEEKWGTVDLTGRTVALQGCGNVGSVVAKSLAALGARLTVCDADPSRAERTSRETGARAVAPEAIYDVDAELFAPCALGAVINDATIPRLRATIVAGAANNQLLEDRHADALAARGILYAPDFIINAGGVISGYFGVNGGGEAAVIPRVDAIHGTLRDIFARAKRENVNTHRAAELVAEEIIARGASR